MRRDFPEASDSSDPLAVDPRGIVSNASPVNEQVQESNAHQILASNESITSFARRLEKDIPLLFKSQLSDDS